MNWKISNNNWNIEMLRRAQEEINLRPEYQRQLVWMLSTKQELIWCMLRGQDIPKFYFHAGRALYPRIWDVVDGQQRLDAIFAYLNNEYPLSIDAKPINGLPIAQRHYKDLPEEVQTAFLSYPIIVAEIETTDRDRVIDQFLSLQKGKALNGQEKRQARPGFLRNLVISLAKHDYVTACQINRKRFQQFETVAKIAMWEWSNKIVETKTGNLDRFYIDHAYCDTEPDPKWKSIHDRILKNFGWLQRMFGQERPELHGINMFLAIYWLARDIRLNHATKSVTSQEFNEWFDSFCTDVVRLREKHRRPAIAKWASSTNTAALQRERFKFTQQHFLETFPYL